MNAQSTPSRSTLWLILLAVLLVAVTVFLAWSQTGELGAAVSSPLSGLVTAIVENDPTVWKVFGILLGCEILGVLASFYVVRAAFKPDARTLLLAVLVALVNFGTLYSQYVDVTELRPLDLLAFFKDGFFWFAALPALASILGIPAVSGKE